MKRLHQLRKKSYTGNIEFIRFDELVIRKNDLKYRPSTETNKEHNPQLTDGDIIIVRKNILEKTTEFMRDLSTPIFTGIGLMRFLIKSYGRQN